MTDVRKDWSIGGDSLTYLYYNSPNIEFNEVPVSSTLIAPRGNIGVGIGY